MLIHHDDQPVGIVRRIDDGHFSSNASDGPKTRKAVQSRYTLLLAIWVPDKDGFNARRG